jgi:hypothetical protein
MNCPRCDVVMEPEYDDGFRHCPECGCEIEQPEQKTMSNTERAEIISLLYKLRADAGVVAVRCQQIRALHIGVNVQGVQNLLDEAIKDTAPDAFQYEMPAELNLAMPKV